ncbi:MAG: FAD-dependent oxidoreductase, partial [Stenotrophobium sp.]
MANQKTKVLVVGGGFAGIKTALELSANPNFDVTLLSDQENFRYYPTLYHTATGGRLSASQIALSEIFAGKDLNIVQDTAKTLDRQAKKLTGKSGKQYDYDYLVLALGVVTNYFGIKGLE